MFCTLSLQNAMTLSGERTSAEGEGYRFERALIDCVVPLRKRALMGYVAPL